MPPSPEKHQLHVQIASGEDRNRIEKLLIATANKFALVDTTVTSRVEQTIKCYSEKLGAGFGLGARMAGDLIIVDFNAIGGHTKNFSAVLEFIKSELERMFGSRLRMATADNYIKAENTLPVSPESREFHRMMSTKLHGKHS